MNENRINLYKDGDSLTGTCTVAEAASNPIFSHWMNGETFDPATDATIHYVNDKTTNPFEDIGEIWYCDKGITSFRSRYYN